MTKRQSAKQRNTNRQADTEEARCRIKSVGGQYDYYTCDRVWWWKEKVWCFVCQPHGRARPLRTNTHQHSTSQPSTIALTAHTRARTLTSARIHERAPLKHK
jgi:hypothetical protein